MSTQTCVGRLLAVSNAQILQTRSEPFERQKKQIMLVAKTDRDFTQEQRTKHNEFKCTQPSKTKLCRDISTTAQKHTVMAGHRAASCERKSSVTASTALRFRRSKRGQCLNKKQGKMQLVTQWKGHVLKESKQRQSDTRGTRLRGHQKTQCDLYHPDERCETNQQSISPNRSTNL